MPTDGVTAACERIRRLAAKWRLPEVTEGTSYGAPALKVRDKTFVTVRNAGELSLTMSLEQKEMLMEMAPDVYYETDHYRGWPAVIVRLPAVGDDELAARLAEAWKRKAPKRLAAQYEATIGPRGGDRRR